MKRTASSVPSLSVPHAVTILLMLISIAVAGCSNTGDGTVAIVSPASPCTMNAGETVPLAVSGPAFEEYEWITTHGTLSSSTGPAVTYTAPTGYSGPVVITVTATKGSNSVLASLTCAVEEDATSNGATEEGEATEAVEEAEPPTPTETPEPTSIPDPMACNHPAVTGWVFPWMTNVTNYFAFSGPESEDTSVFLCQAVYDRYHSEPVSVRVEFHTSGTKFGFWGVGLNQDPGFDASEFRDICFYAYAEQPAQAFRLKLKDRNRVEPGMNVIVGSTNTWTEICTPLSLFTDQGVDLTNLENVNLGFEEGTGDATVWVDDFEFRK